jgi:DNA-binding GntR family transcriptional regulator
MRTACEAEDYMTIAECDIEFHRSLVRRSQQPDLEKLWSSLVGRVRCHFWDTQREDYDQAMDIYAEHVGIFNALRGDDVEAAIKTLEENIN